MEAETPCFGMMIGTQTELKEEGGEGNIHNILIGRK